MDLAALVEAVAVLMSPLEWGSRDAWLAESRRRVGNVLGLASLDAAADPVTPLEALLRLPGDEPGWLHAALASLGGEGRCAAFPRPTTIPETLLPVVSLRCAIVAGLATLQRVEAWRSTLGQAFDELDTGMAIYAPDGLREIARNARLDELLEVEPERDRLGSLIARQARQAATGEGCIPEEDRELELRGGSYRLVASRPAAGTLLAEPAVIVLMERLSSALPTTQELRVSFGLRGREPEIALLAAEGLSNAAIATRLRLSAHTVRHYLERVRDRLGLRTRKALALHLMAPGRRGP